MSKKVTGNDLKKLIKEVLKEETMPSRKEVVSALNASNGLKIKALSLLKKSYPEVDRRDLKTQIDAIIDTLGNPIGTYTPDQLSTTSDDEHIQALRKAGLDDLTKTQLTDFAKISEANVLKEDEGKFEIQDIINYLGQIGLTDPQNFTNIDNLDPKDAIGVIDKFLDNYAKNEKSINTARALRPAKDAIDAAKMRLQGLKPAGGDYRYRTSDRLASPTSIGGETRSPADQSIFIAFETFFAGKATLTERLEHLRDFSTAVVTAARDSGSNANLLNAYSGEIIVTGGNILSMLSKITREFDPSAGGFIAEGFLAYLVAGQKTGQAGGAGDFEDAAGKQYSSKWGQTSKSQAASNFMTVGSRITYITAAKTTEDGAGASKTMKVLNIELQVYDVLTTSVGDTKGSPDGFSIEVGDAGFSAGTGVTRYPKGAKTASYGSYDVSPDGNNYTAYEITFAFSSNDTFDKIFNSAISRTNNQLAKYATEINTQMTILEDKSLTYTVSGDFTEAVAMADAYKDIEALFVNIYKEKTGAADGSQIGLAEQKITASFLKKLISESFKK